ncbi:MAG: hypothetical protein GF364_22650 [Candidatus Lokiarchaeota archaeon]|nr:hypothetical protein [Candidatus Lokiarchaeota archaeon]
MSGKCLCLLSSVLAQGEVKPGHGSELQRVRLTLFGTPESCRGEATRNSQCSPRLAE